MDEEKKMSILGHLNDLRRVLIVSIISLIPASSIGWFYKDQILSLLTRPVDLMNYKLVFLSPTEAFIAKIKLAIMAGILFASPIIAWQLWSFIMPALTKKEKKSMFIVVPTSLFLFVFGVVFAYYTVYNFGVRFLLSFGGEGLTPMLSLSKYLSFAFWFLLPFGIIFELPLVILFLTKIGIVTPQFLAKNRKFALLIAAVVSAIITPTTDVVTLSAMAGPMYILYEISIWISRFIKAGKKDVEEDSDNDNDGDDDGPGGDTGLGSGEDNASSDTNPDDSGAVTAKEDEDNNTNDDTDESTDELIVPYVDEVEDSQKDSVEETQDKADEIKDNADETKDNVDETKDKADEIKDNVDETKDNVKNTEVDNKNEDNKHLENQGDQDAKTKRLEDIYKNITEKGQKQD